VNTLEKFRVIQSLDQALVDRRRTNGLSPEYKASLLGDSKGLDHEDIGVLIRLLSYSIRYPDPAIKVNDSVKVDIATGKITDFVHFDTGVVVMATGGRNMGRVGVVTHRERHDGGFNVVHIKDAIDNTFATRETNVFVIGQDKPWISLPKGKGVKVCYALTRQQLMRNVY
jgi:ribosomal protein S4E